MFSIFSGSTRPKIPESNKPSHSHWQKIKFSRFLLLVFFFSISLATTPPLPTPLEIHPCFGWNKLKCTRKQCSRTKSKSSDFNWIWNICLFCYLFDPVPSPHHHKSFPTRKKRVARVITRSLPIQQLTWYIKISTKFVCTKRWIFLHIWWYMEHIS